MVNDVIPALEKGRRVLSTVRLLDYENPRPCDDAGCTAVNHATHQAAHPLYVPLESTAQLLDPDLEHADILLDEVSGVANARDSSSLPIQLVNKFDQMRRKDLLISWTAPAWGRADKVLRQVTQMVVYCKGLMPVKNALEDREWLDNRLFWLRAYDAAEFEEFTAGKMQKLRARPKQLIWRPGSVAERAYDTFDAVSAFGWAMESGRCAVCDGRRSVPVCKCPREPRQGAQPEPPAATASTSRGSRATRRDRREGSLGGGLSAAL